MLLASTLSFLSILCLFSRGLADAGEEGDQRPLLASDDAPSRPSWLETFGNLPLLQDVREALLPPNKRPPEQRPIIIAAAFPVPGHSLLPIQLAEHLVRRGYDVKSFIGHADYRERLAKSGIELVPIDTAWWMTPDVVQGQFEVPEGPPRLMYHFKHFFLDATPTAMNILRDTLEAVHTRYPGRPVIILHESGYMGLLPFMYGAPLPEGYSKFPKVITVSPSVNSMSSVDLFPSGPGLPPDHSEEGRKRMKMMKDKMQPMYEELARHGNQVYQALGATKQLSGQRPLWDAVIGAYDVTLLFHPPSLEYPRSDLDPSVAYVGALPPTPLDSEFEFPPWWQIIEDNASLNIGDKSKKKVIFVAQGTAKLKYLDLTIPVINALADRNDLLVIATLGERNASLAPEVRIPANVHIVDYLPYEALLPYADVFVSNAGYGGIVTALNYGVPMVLAGEGADKAEVAARAAWAGMAVNLRTGSPAEEQVLRGIEQVLTDPAFKSRALEIREENKSLNPLQSLTNIIDKFTE
jgi:UDP:flavonoid glycosyltransferase YjiC (YdhE family)